MQPDNGILYDLLNKLDGKMDKAVETQTDNHAETIKAVSELQTQMKTLLGNGQKGRITILEEDVDRLKKVRWITAGYAAAIGTAATLIWRAIVAHFWKG